MMMNEYQAAKARRAAAVEDKIEKMARASAAAVEVATARHALYKLAGLYQETNRAEDLETVRMIIAELDRQAADLESQITEAI